MNASAVDPIVLDPNETPRARPFAAISNYAGDIALLNYLLQDLRALVRRAVRSEVDLEPHQVLTWRVHGLERRTVICDPSGLQEGVDVCVVGFFGDRRMDIDRAELDLSELGLIDEFAEHAGLLSYSSVELVDDQWANLVVHRDPGDREDWRTSTIHRHAVADLAPAVYHSVRIHNGGIVGGVTRSNTVVIEATKYWDYDDAPVWHAIRHLPGGESEALVGPIDPLAEETT